MLRRCIGHPAQSKSSSRALNFAQLDERKIQVCARSFASVVDGKTPLVRQFEPHRPAALLLPKSRSIHCVPAQRHVINADGNNVAAAQFAIDRQVEQSILNEIGGHADLATKTVDVQGRSRRITPFARVANRSARLALLDVSLRYGGSADHGRVTGLAPWSTRPSSIARCPS